MIDVGDTITIAGTITPREDYDYVDVVRVSVGLPGVTPAVTETPAGPDGSFTVDHVTQVGGRLVILIEGLIDDAVVAADQREIDVRERPFPTA